MDTHAQTPQKKHERVKPIKMTKINNSSICCCASATLIGNYPIEVVQNLFWWSSSRSCPRRARDMRGRRTEPQIGDSLVPPRQVMSRLNGIVTQVIRFAVLLRDEDENGGVENRAHIQVPMRTPRFGRSSRRIIAIVEE